MSIDYARTRSVRQLRTQLLHGNRQRWDNNRIMADPASHAGDIRHKLGLTLHSPARVAEIERWSADYAETVRQTAEALGWPVPNAIRVRLDWREMRVRARGGTYKSGWRDEVCEVQAIDPSAFRQDGGGISLVGGRYPLEGDLDAIAGTFTEYTTLSADPEIGNHDGNHCQLVIVHEVSHAIQFHLHQQGNHIPALIRRVFGDEALPVLTMGRGHDLLWQSIYRSLRRHFGFTQSPAAIQAAEAFSRQCPQCGKVFQSQPKRGRKSTFCSGKCRVASFRAKASERPECNE